MGSSLANKGLNLCCSESEAFVFCYSFDDLDDEYYNDLNDDDDNDDVRDFKFELFCIKETSSHSCGWKVLKESNM